MRKNRLFFTTALTVVVLSFCPAAAFGLAVENSLCANDFDATVVSAREASADHPGADEPASAAAVKDRRAKAKGEALEVHSAKRQHRAAYRIRVHRLYNLWSDEHLYTIDAAECAYLVSEGWLYEGTGWQAPSWSETPVYRLFDPKAGTHFFTADEHERRVLTKRHGWKDDGVAFFADEGSHRIPVYRLYNRWSGEHFFTVSKIERKSLIRQGWKAEGIGWCAAAPGAPARSVVYRSAHWRYFLDRASGSPDVTVQNGSITPELSERLAQYASTGVPVGFVAINKRTGKTVACSPDYREFSASTMKAVYSTALCKYGAPGIGDHVGELYNALTYSSNEDYNSLCYTYGLSYLDRIAEEACVAPDMRYSTAYADVTPREMAKLWLVVSEYLQETDGNAGLLRSSFGLGEFYKEGWMEPYTWTGQIYHLAGTQGDVVYSIMSRWGRPSADMWSLRADIFEALG